MDHSPFESLTDEQRECLRLVAYEHLTSKEIARRLGRSKTAIDQRLDRARQTLGAADRDAAARLLIDYEAGRDRVTRDPQPLVQPAPIAAASSISAATYPSRFHGWVAALEGVDPDDLSVRTRAVLILACAVAFAFIVGGIGIGSGAVFALLAYIRALIA